MWKFRSVTLSVASALLLGSLATFVHGQGALDPRLPAYRPVSELQGELKLAGSNTMSQVAAVWSSGFRRFYPDVKISIDIRGSRGAVAAVQSEEADLGLLSRTIKEQESEKFKKQFGYVPTVLTPCFERLAIYVHKDNPISGLSFRQLDAIFSANRKRGAKGPIQSWGKVGLEGAWSSRPIVVHGRTKDTGSQVFMRDVVLQGGAFRDDIVGHRNNLSMVKAIAEDPQSIGFAGISYQRPGVRAVPLAVQEGGSFVASDASPVPGEVYPLVRPLQLVVNYSSEHSLRPIEKEFIKYAFSQLGQEDVIKAGYDTTDFQTAHMSLDTVGLSPIR